MALIIIKWRLFYWVFSSFLPEQEKTADGMRKYERLENETYCRICHISDKELIKSGSLSNLLSDC